MTKQKSTRKTLLTSVLSLILCMAMLIGTTFAWFTDSATSGKNRIQAGNLDVAMSYKNTSMSDYEDVETPTSPDFFKDINGDKILWEPGAVAYANFKVENKGTLALKYSLQTIVAGCNYTVEGKSLADALTVKVVKEEQTYATREAAVNVAKNSADILENFAHVNNNLEAEKTDYFTVILYWEPSSNDNDFNVNPALWIDIELSLVATQAVNEADSFDNQYDVSATYPIVAAAMKTGAAVEMKASRYSLEIPNVAEDGKYTLTVTNEEFTEDASGEITFSFDVALLRDGVRVGKTEGVTYKLDIELGDFLNIKNVKNAGEEISNYTYENGTLSLETDFLGTVTMTYKEAAENLVMSGDKIIGGVFKGINPAEYDATLAEADSEYIAINYKKDGETQYVVSKRSQTVIVAADGAEDYIATNENYNVEKNKSGQLQGLMKSLENNEFSVVYLLPGTYKEASTVYIYSDMEIIGLGDAEDIKVIKQSSSNSNRHLFNVNGASAEEYIKVSIKNLYLNSTKDTTGGKDNAAVQAIGLAKVKCYDLIIEKEKDTSTTNFEGYQNYAFYVNSNGTSTGAYMYVENTVVSSANTGYILTTKTPYKFQYFGLTYASGEKEYTQTSTTIINQRLDSNDWDW